MRILGAALLSGALAAAPALAADPSGRIGQVAVVLHEASVVHPQQPEQVIRVALGDTVLFQDTYETREAARLKLLFEDDSLVSLGENTRLQITEEIYDPGRDLRSTTMSLFLGRIRALVGHHFAGVGSRFEIHTRSTVAAARGTYFIVRVSGCAGGSGCAGEVTEVLNIGQTGQVDVRQADPAVGGEVELGPGEFTQVTPSAPPALPAAAGPELVAELMAETAVPDTPVEELPSAMEVPGAAEALEEPSERPGKSAWSLGVGGVPTAPPYLQTPTPSQAGVAVELVF